MKSTLILFFTPVVVLGTPFLGNLFTPRVNNESHISDFRDKPDKSKAQLQLQEDDEKAQDAPQQMDGMRRKIQLYGRLFGNFIGALQDGIEDTSRKSFSAKLHLSPTQARGSTATARKIDGEGRNPFERLVADGRRWQEGLRERKLVFLTTNILPNLVSTWRSVMQTFKPTTESSEEEHTEDTEGLDLNEEESGEMKTQSSLQYLPAKENSWDALRNALKSLGGEDSPKSAKIEEEPPPKLNAVVMLELFGTIFGVTWNILSQIGTLLRN